MGIVGTYGASGGAVWCRHRHHLVTIMSYKSPNTVHSRSQTKAFPNPYELLAKTPNKIVWGC